MVRWRNWLVALRKSQGGRYTGSSPCPDPSTGGAVTSVEAVKVEPVKIKLKSKH